jgi:hypothetical protein
MYPAARRSGKATGWVLVRAEAVAFEGTLPELPSLCADRGGHGSVHPFDEDGVPALTRWDESIINECCADGGHHGSSGVLG